MALKQSKYFVIMISLGLISLKIWQLWEYIPIFENAIGLPQKIVPGHILIVNSRLFQAFKIILIPGYSRISRPAMNPILMLDLIWLLELKKKSINKEFIFSFFKNIEYTDLLILIIGLQVIYHRSFKFIFLFKLDLQCIFEKTDTEKFWQLI